MNRTSTVVLTALLLLAGCAGTRTPKLARCTGPYRYANPFGTVLPTLPIPGQPSPALSDAKPSAPPISAGAAAGDGNPAPATPLAANHGSGQDQWADARLSELLSHASL